MGCLWLPTPHCAAPVWLRVCHATPLVTRYFPPTFYRECYGLERAFFTIKRFLPCTPSCWFWGFPETDSPTSKLAGLHADHQNIVLAQLLGQMTAIHKRGILLGSVYMPKSPFEVRVPQTWDLPLTDFEPAFLKDPCVSALLS